MPTSVSRSVEHASVVYDEQSCVREGCDSGCEEEDTRRHVPHRYGAGSVHDHARGSSDAEQAKSERRCIDPPRVHEDIPKAELEGDFLYVPVVLKERCAGKSRAEDE
jgi:hypothetical protein